MEKSNFLSSIIDLLKKIIPTPINSVLGLLGFNKLLPRSWKKYTEELAFQTEWVTEFIDNKSKVLEYWRKYRYLDDINAICKIKNNIKVLDVGCGISSVLHFIDGERYGIDPLADKYKKIYSYPKEINIQKSFGEKIPFPDKYFDVVFCSNVLDHVTHPQKTINEIYRVLKPSGYFVLTVEVFKEKTERDPSHPHSLTKKGVLSLLRGKFEPLLEKESPWIGVRRYINGLLTSRNKELITVMQKA